MYKCSGGLHRTNIHSTHNIAYVPSNNDNTANITRDSIHTMPIWPTSTSSGQLINEDSSVYVRTMSTVSLVVPCH